MMELIEWFRLERLHEGGITIMCECPSYDVAQQALMFYASDDATGAMYRITKYFKVVHDDVGA